MACNGTLEIELRWNVRWLFGENIFAEISLGGKSTENSLVKTLPKFLMNFPPKNAPSPSKQIISLRMTVSRIFVFGDDFLLRKWPRTQW